MSTTEPRSRYHEACVAGRDWALQAQAQDLRRMGHTQPAFDNAGQHLDPPQLALAHQNPSHPPPPQR